MLHFLVFAFAVILNFSFTTAGNPEKLELYCQPVDLLCFV